MTEQRDATPQELADLAIARELAANGIPIFVCPPNPYKPGKYFFKADWQNTRADPAVLDQWKPGWGVGAVGGTGADFLDVDPRSGGHESVQELKQAGHWPYTFGTAATPSGGTHHIISRTGERKETGFMPGVDFQAGGDVPDEKGSKGRAFVWLAPTVGRSKTTGELVPYRWVEAPDLEALDEWRHPDGSNTDPSTEAIVSRVYAHRRRNKATPAVTPREIEHADSQLFSPAGQIGPRAFTEQAAREFVTPALLALREAPIGQIEEIGMAATLQIEHFVPEFWTAEQAYAVICDALSHTAYDPNGPSDWTADKFLARLDGRRPVEGSWKAVRQQEITYTAPAPPAPITSDEVESLLAELLTPSAIKARPAKKYLIKTLLLMNTEAWLIGEPGSKKSFVALDMAGHIAAGREWQGLKVTQGNVLIIAAEGADGIGARIAAYEAEHGPMPENVFILPRPVQARDTRAWKMLIEVATRVEPVLIIGDTQARLTVGLEENSAMDMGIYVDAVAAMRRATGACVLSIHHTGRKGGDARGSSALDGAQDTELAVKVTGKLAGQLEVHKQKDLIEREPIPLAFAVHEVGTDEDGDPITSLALRGADAWREAAGEIAAVDVGQVQTISEPAAWLVATCRPDAIVQHRILQTLLDVAGLAGLTEARVRALVAERWHGGQTGRKPGALNLQAFQKSWGVVLDRDEVIRGEVGSASWSLDPEWVKAEALRFNAQSAAEHAQGIE
jgi:hypothetical protein